MFQRILAGKLPKKKTALAVVGNPDDHPPYVVLLCQQRINLGPKKAKVWMDKHPMPRKDSRHTPFSMLPVGTQDGAKLMLNDGNIRLVVFAPNGTVDDIKEQAVVQGIPDDASAEHTAEYTAAWMSVTADVFSGSRKLALMMPQDFFPIGKASAWKLKGRTADEFEKALRAKSRLGKWL